MVFIKRARRKKIKNPYHHHNTVYDKRFSSLVTMIIRINYPDLSRTYISWTSVTRVSSLQTQIHTCKQLKMSDLRQSSTSRKQEKAQDLSFFGIFSDKPLSRPILAPTYLEDQFMSEEDITNYDDIIENKMI